MNSIEITGRLVRDIEPVRNRRTGELVQTRMGKYLYTSSIADQHSKKDGDVSYFRFIMYGEAGEQASKQFKKGDLVYVRGWMKQNRWKDGTTGKNVSDFELRIQELDPVSPKAKSAPEGEDDVPLWIEGAGVEEDID